METSPLSFMEAFEIVCIIGAILVSFLIGRATKKTSLPILGEVRFEEGKADPYISFYVKRVSEFKDFDIFAVEVKDKTR